MDAVQTLQVVSSQIPVKLWWRLQFHLHVDNGGCPFIPLEIWIIILKHVLDYKTCSRLIKAHKQLKQSVKESNSVRRYALRAFLEMSYVSHYERTYYYYGSYTYEHRMWELHSHNVFSIQFGMNNERTYPFRIKINVLRKNCTCKATTQFRWEDVRICYGDCKGMSYIKSGQSVKLDSGHDLLSTEEPDSLAEFMFVLKERMESIKLDDDMTITEESWEMVDDLVHQYFNLGALINYDELKEFNYKIW